METAKILPLYSLQVIKGDQRDGVRDLGLTS